jgi:TPR repeat protein
MHRFPVQQMFMQPAFAHEASPKIGLAYTDSTGKVAQKMDPASLVTVRTAADLGDATAQAHLGNCHWRGNGVVQDENRAAVLFKQAADQGHADGQAGLANCYAFGRGMAQDYTKAAVLYVKAADQKHAGGQAGLATCYLMGHGIEQDDTKAAALYRKAADQKHTSGQCGLGNCYFYGRGLEQDYTKAVKFYQQAADQGHPGGQAALAKGKKALLEIDAEQQQRRTAEAEDAMRLLLQEEEGAGGAADGKQSKKKKKKKKQGRRAVAAAAAPCADTEAQKGGLEEEERVQRVREQLLQERAEAAERERAFKKAQALQIHALAAATAAAARADADAKAKGELEEEERAFEEAKVLQVQALAAAAATAAAALQQAEVGATGEVAAAPCPQQPQAMMPSPPPIPTPQLPPECPVCMECYDRPPSEQAPVVLPCGHSVCRQCALDVQTATPSCQRGAGALTIVCPSCRQLLELPSGGAQALPYNYGLLQVLEPSAPMPLQQAAAAPLSAALPHRIAALEQFWSEAGSSGAAGLLSFVARMEALELIVIGTVQTGTLLARATVLEQHGGLCEYHAEF